MKKFTSSFKIAAVLIAGAAMVSVAHAWIGPGSNSFPNGNVEAPINTGLFDQVKKAGITATNLNALADGQTALTWNNSPKGNATIGHNLFTNVAMIGKTLTANRGYFGGSCIFCTDPTDGGVFSAGSFKFDGKGDLLSGVRVDGLGSLRYNFTNGGANPLGAGKVLTSVDDKGNAVWGDGVGTPVTVSTDGLMRYVRSQTVTDVAGATVYCGGNNSADDANWVAVGGGGWCVAGIASSEPIAVRSINGIMGTGAQTGPAIGWRVLCLTDSPNPYPNPPINRLSGSTGGSQRDTYASVVCMKKTPIVTGFTTEPVQNDDTSSGTPASWRLANGPSNPTSISCSSAYGTTSGKVGLYVQRSNETTTSSGPFTFPTLPSTFSTPDTSLCAINNTPYVASSGHLPTGYSWVGSSTSAAKQSLADGIWYKERYYTLKFY